MTAAARRRSAIGRRQRLAAIALMIALLDIMPPSSVTKRLLSCWSNPQRRMTAHAFSPVIPIDQRTSRKQQWQTTMTRTAASPQLPTMFNYDRFVRGKTIRWLSTNDNSDNVNVNEHGQNTATMVSSSNEDSSQQRQEPQELDMENLYREWTLEDDQRLWREYSQQQQSSSSFSSLVPLALLLGRGLGGVRARLTKLQDVDSAAYQRLFVEHGHKQKLIPAGEVLRRIQWDYTLNAQDFFVIHYDRVDDALVESPATAPNQQISGSEQLLINALPEHRIVAIKYKRRVVWDRAQRRDLVFGSGNVETTNEEDGDDDKSSSSVTTIEQVVATYDEWWRSIQKEQELLQTRRHEINSQMRQILGPTQLLQLEQSLIDSNLGAEASNNNNANDPPAVANQLQIEAWVAQTRQVFRDLREQSPEDVASLDPTLIPLSDYDALNVVSEWVALLPVLESLSPLTISFESEEQPQTSLDTTSIEVTEHAKKAILLEINGLMHQVTQNNKQKQQKQLPKNRSLPTLNEHDLTETFVRGSGPGGQKINKTANKVVLVHEPTQLRVECQETRSLQQNRKIARRRMRQKLDDYLNGSQSKSQQAAQRASKSKARAKNRARQKQKKLNKQKKQKKQQKQEDGTDPESFLV